MMLMNKEKYKELMKLMYSVGATMVPYDDIDFSPGSCNWVHPNFSIATGKSGDNYQIVFYIRTASDNGLWWHPQFETFLNNLSSDLQEDFLFHLDLFT